MNKKIIFYVLFCMGIAFHGDVCAMERDDFAAIECCPDPYRFGPIDDTNQVGELPCFLYFNPKNDSDYRKKRFLIAQKITDKTYTKLHEGSYLTSILKYDDYHVVHYIYSALNQDSELKKKMVGALKVFTCHIRSKAVAELIATIPEIKVSYGRLLRGACDDTKRLDLMRFYIDKLKTSFDQKQVEVDAQNALGNFYAYAKYMPNAPGVLACAKKKIDMLLEIGGGNERSSNPFSVVAQIPVITQLSDYYCKQVELHAQQNADNLAGALNQMTLGNNTFDDDWDDCDDDAMEE